MPKGRKARKSRQLRRCGYVACHAAFGQNSQMIFDQMSESYKKEKEEKAKAKAQSQPQAVLQDSGNECDGQASDNQYTQSPSPAPAPAPAQAPSSPSLPPSPQVSSMAQIFDETAAKNLGNVMACLDNIKSVNNENDNCNNQVSKETKEILTNSVEWQQSLYKNDRNAIKEVQNIVENLEQESKQESQKHESYASVTEVKEYTKAILSNKTGDPNDKNTLFQLISELSPNAMFYDPKQKSTFDKDSKENDAPKAVLKLTKVPGFDDIKDNETSEKAQKQLISEMKYSLKNNISAINQKEHPILRKTREALAESLNVSVNDVIITNVYYGSCCFDYTIENAANYGNILSNSNVDNNLKAKFKYFESNKVHPSFFELFNVNDFDHRGNKHFGSGATFEVGPPGKTEKYEQPTGYTRYGLNVLNGKYGNDHTWLDPFQHANNWYRAYHGVKGGLTIAKIIRDGGFLPGAAQACQSHADKYDGKPLGVGVYCSPKLSIAEGYSTTIDLRLNNGTSKKFRFLFQVCVDPKKIRRSSSADGYWVAPNSIGMVGGNQHVEDNIRPYGILLKEV